MDKPGMNRKIDKLGRIVIPAEIRSSLGLRTGSSMSISMDEGRIVLARHQEACFNCGSTEELGSILDRKVCGRCAADLRSAGWGDTDLT